MCKYKYMHRAHGNKIMINEENSIIPQLNKSSQSTNIMGTMDPEPICWSFSFNAMNLIANKQQRMTTIVASWWDNDEMAISNMICSIFARRCFVFVSFHILLFIDRLAYTTQMSKYIHNFDDFSCETKLSTCYTVHLHTNLLQLLWMTSASCKSHAFAGKSEMKGRTNIVWKYACLSVWVDYLLLIEIALTLISCILPLPDAFFFVSFDIESMHKCCTLFVFICMCVCVISWFDASAQVQTMCIRRATTVGTIKANIDTTGIWKHQPTIC